MRNVIGKMLTCGLLATALAVTAMQASAQDVTVRGGGTCQAYLDAKHKASIDEAVKRFVWLLGYVSGLAVGTHVDVLANDDGAEVMLKWVDSYCETYPANRFREAGDLYYRILKGQMKAAAYPK